MEGGLRAQGPGIEGGGCRVALAGMLRQHTAPHPEVPSHLQVQPTVSTGVAARVGGTALLDADGLVPAGTGRGQPLTWGAGGGQECLARCHHSILREPGSQPRARRTPEGPKISNT